MISKITDKFQITIPKEIRSKMKLSRNDSLVWKFEGGKLVVEPVKKPFLKFRGSVKTGEGDIGNDIREARRRRAERSK